MTAQPTGLLEILTDPARFTLFKKELVDAADLSRDALHMHIGLAMAVGLFLILGRRWWSALLAWLTVFAVTLWGERLDHLSDPWLTVPERQWAKSIHDVANTMFWPTLMLLILLWVSSRRPPRSLLAGEKSAQSGDGGDEPFE